MRRADYIIGLILIALGIFIYFSSYSIPVMAIVEKTGMVNSRFFPKLCAICLIVLSMIMILENYIVAHKQEEKLKDQDERKEGIGSIRLFVAAALTFMYLITYQYLGHLVSTFIFLFVFMYFLSTRNLFLLISVPVAISFSIYLVFKILLEVPLPVGTIF